MSCERETFPSAEKKEARGSRRRTTRRVVMIDMILALNGDLNKKSGGKDDHDDRTTDLNDGVEEKKDNSRIHINMCKKSDTVTRLQISNSAWAR